jgi:hypothetical protein
LSELNQNIFDGILKSISVIIVTANREYLNKDVDAELNKVKEKLIEATMWLHYLSDILKSKDRIPEIKIAVGVKPKDTN